MTSANCCRLISEIYTYTTTKPWSAKRLDELESNLQHRFMTLEKHGGMNLRDENKRKRKEIGL